jgi:hypothetical protein
MRSDEGVSRRADTLIRVHGKEMDHALLPQRLRPAAVVKTERMVGSNCDARPAKVGDGLIMVVSDPDIHRAARLHLERHVDEAVTKACDMVRNLKARGDNEAADTWLQIIVEIEVLQRGSAR